VVCLHDWILWIKMERNCGQLPCHFLISSLVRRNLPTSPVVLSTDFLTCLSLLYWLLRFYDYHLCLSDPHKIKPWTMIMENQEWCAFHLYHIGFCHAMD
jgi:hypothetical protein